MKNQLTDEQHRALCEADCNAASDEYFGARPQLDSDVNRRIFYAGHRKAWLHQQAEMAPILAASRYTCDLCTQALDTVREQTAEIAANDRLFAAYKRVVAEQVAEIAALNSTVEAERDLNQRLLAIHLAHNNPVMPEEQAKLKVALTEVFGWKEP